MLLVTVSQQSKKHHLKKTSDFLIWPQVEKQSIDLKEHSFFK
jgi:hypothetical protein